MRMHRGQALAMAVAGVVGWAGAAASAQQPPELTPAELRAQIEALQKQVQRLEANQQNEAQAAAQQTKAEVMADAEKRSTVGGGKLLGGYEDGKFILRAPDDASRRAEMQRFIDDLKRVAERLQ